MFDSSRGGRQDKKSNLYFSKAQELDSNSIRIVNKIRSVIQGWQEDMYVPDVSAQEQVEFIGFSCSHTRHGFRFLNSMKPPPPSAIISMPMTA